MSVQEGDAEVAQFISRYQLSYPFLMDRTGEVSLDYRVTSTPTTFFISPDGVIVDRLAGIVTESWLERNIDVFVAG